MINVHKREKKNKPARRSDSSVGAKLLGESSRMDVFFLGRGGFIGLQSVEDECKTGKEGKTGHRSPMESDRQQVGGSWSSLRLSGVQRRRGLEDGSDCGGGRGGMKWRARKRQWRKSG